MKDFIRVMKALSEPNRVKILKVLQRGPLCVCNIQATLGIAQPTVSNHLKVLEEAGLVTSRKEGQWVRYRLGDGGRSPYAASLLGHLRHWLEDSWEKEMRS
jgi:ArsR family transcriptional regulator